MKINVRPDLEKVRSMKGIIEGRLSFIRNFKGKVFATVICENYYEVIKELAVALFLCKGVKFIGEYSHKELIGEVVKLIGLGGSYSVFLDDLRSRRNGSLYYGEGFEDIYLKNNEDKIINIIKKIKVALDEELK